MKIQSLFFAVSLMLFLLFFDGSPALYAAEPTEERAWNSTAGTTITAKATRIENEVVTLITGDGRSIEVPLGKLSEADQAFVTNHFQDDPAAPPPATSSTGTPVADLAHPLGQTVGPITTPEGSNYFVYLPTTLKSDRKAPLILFTNAGGGSAKIVDHMIEGAELNGWIAACSVESRNKNDTDDNHRHCRNAVEHLFATLPIDEDRLYFTGGSGGGAMSLRNASEMNHAGAIPMIGYIPSGATVSGGDYVVINGATDYNRYTSAHARKTFGDNAVHRFHPGGHSKGPFWLMTDAMTRLNGRYLADKGKDLTEERTDFEASLINWIQKLRDSNEPWRSYEWALFLQEEYEISGPNQPTVQELVAELGADEINRKYVEGLAALDEFSEDQFSGVSTGSLMGHSTTSIQRAAEELAEKYAGIPHIEETAIALGKPTVSQKNK
ncbi:MAG: hypothetical protein AAGD22_15150 [Verrucomicrobiota bacterium]